MSFVHTARRRCRTAAAIWGGWCIVGGCLNKSRENELAVWRCNGLIIKRLATENVYCAFCTDSFFVRREGRFLVQSSLTQRQITFQNTRLTTFHAYLIVILTHNFLFLLPFHDDDNLSRAFKNHLRNTRWRLLGMNMWRHCVRLVFVDQTKEIVTLNSSNRSFQRAFVWLILRRKLCKY